MTLQSRRGSAVIRQVLKQVINIEQSNPSKRSQDIQKLKLNQVIIFLQKKIDRQHTQIKVISQQLSKEISLKQQILASLNQQKEKSCRLGQHLAAANRLNSELKVKLNHDKSDPPFSQKQQFEMKINKYREIVRKKDQLLTKNQQKLEQLLKNQQNLNKLQYQIKNLRASFGRLKSRQQNLTNQVQKLTNKLSETTQILKQKQQIIKNMEIEIKRKDEEMYFIGEHLKRVKSEYDQLLKQYEQDQDTCRQMEKNAHKVIDQQARKIKELSQRSIQPFTVEQAKWDLSIFKKQVKRCLQFIVKDSNLRRRIQKEIIELLSQIQISFTNILIKMFELK